MNSCVETVNHSAVKVEEKGRKAVFLNPQKEKFQRGKIDGCLVVSGVRADYFVNGEGKSVLVELKGAHVDHACEQLIAAARHPHVKPYLSGKLGFLVICSRYPKESSKVQLYREKIASDFGAKLKIFSDQREVSMSIF